MEKYDKNGKTSYCLGTTICFELFLRAPKEALSLYVSPKQKRDETYDKLVGLAHKAGVPVIENNEKPFRQADKDNVMFIAEFRKFVHPLPQAGNHVVLVNPSNMGNLGTILRSCAAFSIGGLSIIKPAADVYDPKVVRSSMGAIFSVPFECFDSFEEYQKKSGLRGFYPFMLKATTILGNEKKPTASFSVTRRRACRILILNLGSRFSSSSRARSIRSTSTMRFRSASTNSAANDSWPPSR